MDNFKFFLHVVFFCSVWGQIEASQTGQHIIQEDTIVKVNFTFSPDYCENGWVNVYDTSSFLVDLGDGIKLEFSTNGNSIKQGISEVKQISLPYNVGRTYHYLENPYAPNAIKYRITGLDPKGSYTFYIFSSQCDSSDDKQRTVFSIANESGRNPGEMLLGDEIYTYDDKLQGFKYWYMDSRGHLPDNWKNPYDYELGEIYTRYQVISQASTLPAKLSFGLWQDNLKRETFSVQVPVNGPGSIATAHSSPLNWWEKDKSNPLDFSRVNDFYAMGIPLWSDNTKLVSPLVDQNERDWDKRSYYHPMKVRATVVAVPYEGQFSGWEHWVKTKGINATINSDSLLEFSRIQPSHSGEVVVDMTNNMGASAYINALIIAKLKTYKLSITTKGNGNVTGAMETYNVDTKAELVAVSEPGWKFSGWVGDSTSSNRELIVNMDSNKHFEAVFTQLEFDSLEIVAKINFAPDKFEEPGWSTVSYVFPASLEGGLSIDNSGDAWFEMGKNGEPESMLPFNVGSTCLYIDSDNSSDILKLVISGLDPGRKYNFYIFASRSDATISNARYSTFAIDSFEPLSIDAIGNTDSLLTFRGIIPDSSGKIFLEMTGKNGEYAYLNAIVISGEFGDPGSYNNLDGIEFYPSPVKDQLTIFGIPQNSVINGYDFSGKKIIAKQTGNKSSIEINMVGLNSGIYIFQVRNKTNRKTFKVIRK